MEVKTIMMNRSLFALVVFAASLIAGGSAHAACFEKVYEKVGATWDGKVEVEGHQIQLVVVKSQLLRKDCSLAIETIARFMEEVQSRAKWAQTGPLAKVKFIVIEDCPLPSSGRHSSAAMLQEDGKTLSLCIFYPWLRSTPSDASENTRQIATNLEKLFPDPTIAGRGEDHSRDVIGTDYSGDLKAFK
jgi:hypothetical protein